MNEDVIFLFTVNSRTVLLKSSCFCNRKIQRAFNLSSVDVFLSASSSLAARW